MIKIDCRNGNELLRELIKCSMHEMIDVMWDGSEEELTKSFEIALATPDDENRPTLFSLMQVAGLAGNILVLKHGKDEKELMKMLKDSDALFVKEIVSE
uniref:hypothetical protein n=1 Tax=Anaerococcus mediterraneensis TaxID=1870984 RepID=UPI00092FF42A|nr:hypothetical protein [Anaerococcus mediterraneensis]